MRSPGWEAIPSLLAEVVPQTGLDETPYAWLWDSGAALPCRGGPVAACGRHYSSGNSQPCVCLRVRRDSQNHFAKSSLIFQNARSNDFMAELLIDYATRYVRTLVAVSFSQEEFQMAFDTLDELRTLYRPPAPRAELKVLDRLDEHCRRFIALSPFYVIGSACADGRADVSPRGDPPGSLALIPDDRTLLLPDRPGNRQVDTLMNLVERPYVGLLFFIPGFTETLRVNGRAEISIDPDLLELLSIKGKPPISILKVSVEEAFLHCSKALIRAKLWDSKAQVERSCYPSYGQVLADQIAGADAAEIDAGEEESARTELY